MKQFKSSGRLSYLALKLAKGIFILGGILVGVIVVYLVGDEVFYNFCIKKSSEKGIKNFSELPADVRAEMIDFFDSCEENSLSCELPETAVDLEGGHVNVFSPGQFSFCNVVQNERYEVRVNRCYPKVFIFSRDTLYYPLVKKELFIPGRHDFNVDSIKFCAEPMNETYLTHKLLFT